MSFPLFPLYDLRRLKSDANIPLIGKYQGLDLNLKSRFKYYLQIMLVITGALYSLAVLPLIYLGFSPLTGVGILGHIPLVSAVFGLIQYSMNIHILKKCKSVADMVDLSLI